MKTPLLLLSTLCLPVFAQATPLPDATACRETSTFNAATTGNQSNSPAKPEAPAPAPADKEREPRPARPAYLFL